MFREGRESVEDNPRMGRKPKINAALTSSVKEIIDGDRRLTVRDISQNIGISVGTVHTILTDKFGMNQVSARWIPRYYQQIKKSAELKTPMDLLNGTDEEEKNS